MSAPSLLRTPPGHAGRPGPEDPPFPCSSAFLRAVSRAERYARDPTLTILLEGESGTGKSQLSRELHACSPRARGPFERVVLSTLDDALSGSELFGHVAGAYTDARSSRTGRFASAQGGTLMLDEVGKASLTLQGKLLHAIEYHEVRPLGTDRDIKVDVRVMAASNLPLEQLVDEGRFLPDLAARLVPFRVRIPPLRERREDVPHLVSQYLARHGPATGYAVPPEVDENLMAALVHAPWPMNLRQLDATVHRLLLEAEGAPVLTLGHCEEDLGYLRRITRATTPLTPERIDSALSVTKSKAAAARLLGVDRTTLHRHLRRTAPEQGSGSA